MKIKFTDVASTIPHQSTTYSIGYDDSIHHFWLSIHFLYHREHCIRKMEIFLDSNGSWKARY
jgi:hypothetical protein